MTAKAKAICRTECIAMAQQSCSICYGLGVRPGRGGSSVVCHCVYRSIFRACYARFRQCAAKEKYISRVALESNPGNTRKSVWGMKNEEFIADFCLIGRRELSEAEYALFKYHFLLGADWKLCCRKLNVNRGQFFHAVYRIQQKLGRVFRDMEPFALFPLDEYFHGNRRKEPHPLLAVEHEAEAVAPQRKRFPFAKAAA